MPVSGSSSSPRADGFILYGATGDLAQRMLFASLYNLEGDGFLPANGRVVAVLRGSDPDAQLLATIEASVRKRAGDAFDPHIWQRLAARISFFRADVRDAEHGVALAARLRELGVTVPVFFLAISPSLYTVVCAALLKGGLAAAPSRLALEKPLGRDLASSIVINTAVAEGFSEDRVFRLDHYLGKETVQNLLALRFGNTIFERLWNNLTVDHVQITVAETEGVGERWPYYDEYGALRDMVQNHVLQLLCLLAMEPPSDLAPDSVRNEKVKVLKALRPMTAADAAATSVRGQYSAGMVDGNRVRAYADECGTASDTETYVALRVAIDNWRWAGVPFFIRTGKRMAERRTQVVLQLREVPHSIFGDGGRGLTANRIVIDLQPDEDISLLLMNKSPGITRDGMRLRALPLSLAGSGPTVASSRRIAYERLILDMIDDNSTLFVRRDEVEQAWSWVDGVVSAWQSCGLRPGLYPGGSWGPSGSFALIERFGRSWNE